MFFLIAGIIALVALVINIICLIEEPGDVKSIVWIIICGLLLIGCIICGIHYFNNSASGSRFLKDVKSEYSDGLDRTIVITAEDGREIYRYKGKIDLEMHDNYLFFDDENDKRQIIYWGVTDTVIIIEN